MYINIAK